MKRVRKLLMLLAGLAVFLCATPTFGAEQYDDPTIKIPYAVHYGDWWSGLAVSNVGFHKADVEIYYLRESILTHLPNRLVLAGKFRLKSGATMTKMLPDFFTETPFPDEGMWGTVLGNQYGRVALIIKAKGSAVLGRDIRATLFTGNNGPGGGFSYQVFEGRD